MAETQSLQRRKHRVWEEMEIVREVEIARSMQECLSQETAVMCDKGYAQACHNIRAVVSDLRAVSQSGTPVERQPKEGAVGVGKQHLLCQ